ncbi:MAG: sigma-54-dependent Fis family transcriptional regulator [Archangiaceae bacterium]|nr:sigma-54-dependent Fis family transcriptional regulator [Archangiaceae bacterium]
MNRPGSVLLVDDDVAVRKVLAALLTQGNIAVTEAGHGAEALEKLGKTLVDVVVTDLRMPGVDGMQLLEQVTARWPDLPVILITAHGSVPLAVEAIKKGAADFVLKPFDKDELLFTISKALAKAKHQAAAPASAAAGSEGELWGESQAMVEVRELISKAATGTATVLLRGESGTGKELAARQLHQSSKRKDKPFVTINCGAFPDTLLESELFGYEKGAFTGAVNRKLGRVELADGGTLFLDEIGDVTPATQVKLLRLIQERELVRLGGNQTVKIDVRFVAATHRPLEEMVKRGEFREDLFYRLNVVPITLPPLRSRGGDIALLATRLMQKLGPENARPKLRFHPDALALVAGQSWPGNVRQLRNFIERLAVLSGSDDEVSAADVERELKREATLLGGNIAAPSSGGLDERRAQVEREALLEALKKSNDNRTQAARILGISRRTLYNKLAEHGLE